MDMVVFLHHLSMYCLLVVFQVYFTGVDEVVQADWKVFIGKRVVPRRLVDNVI